MGSFSLTHLLVLIILILIFTGPRRIPELGRGIGRAIRGFKDELKGPPPEEPPPRDVGSNRKEELPHQKEVDSEDAR